MAKVTDTVAALALPVVEAFPMESRCKTPGIALQ